MEFVTAVLLAFVLVCLICPHVVKHRAQFLAAVGMVLLLIFLQMIARMDDGITGDHGLRKFMYFISGIIQIATTIVFVLATTESFSQLREEMSSTIDVVRRGGEHESVIVPLKGEEPRRRDR